MVSRSNKLLCLCAFNVPISITCIYCRSLIRFVDSDTAPVWHGYVYAGLMFAATVLQSFFINQYFMTSFRLGMHIRTAVVAAVYRKVKFHFVRYDIRSSMSWFKQLLYGSRTNIYMCSTTLVLYTFRFSNQILNNKPFYITKNIRTAVIEKKYFARLKWMNITNTT